MKKAPLLILGSLLYLVSFSQVRKDIGNLSIEGIPDIPPHLMEKLQTFLNVRAASFSDWTSDGKSILISTRFGDVPQIHKVDGPGMARTQMTFFSEPMGFARSSPLASRNMFLFTKDVGGNEDYQIYGYDLSSRQYTMLTDGKSRHESVFFSPKGDKFAFTGNQRNGADMDIYIYIHYLDKDVMPKLVLKVEGGGWSIQDWSKDEKRMIIKNYISVNESQLFILNVEEGKLTVINPSDEKINYGEAKFSADEKGIFLVSDQAGEFSQLKFLDLTTGKQFLISGDIQWDVEGFVLNKTRDLVAFECNQDGYSSLYIYDIKKGLFNRVTALPKGSLTTMGFNPGNNQLAFTISTYNPAGDVYVLNTDLFMGGKLNQAIQRWTFSETGNLNVAGFVEPQIFRYPTFDSIQGKPRMIPCIMYKPKNIQGKSAVMIHVHGGPESQSKPGFNPLYQYLVNELGITVLVPNVRGSTGYGKYYVALDNGFLRENSVKDIGSLLNWIAKEPGLDAQRVGVWGGSYGGYMTLASMTHFNDRLKMGIDVVGISNFVTFLKNTSDYRRDLRRVEYGDERDPAMREFLEKISPNNNVHKITRPMFVAQGLNDPRVPVTEAEQMVNALRKKGNICWYLLARDEGHGFRKKSNNDFYLASVILFIQEYLLKN